MPAYFNFRPLRKSG